MIAYENIIHWVHQS